MSASPPPAPQHDEPAVAPTGRWLITGGLLLLALPVTGLFWFFARIAAQGCLVDCTQPAPRPGLAALLLLGAATMAGAWAGLVPWAMGRRGLIVRTVALGALLVVAAFGLTLLVS
jgi:hypothetical protein